MKLLQIFDNKPRIGDTVAHKIHGGKYRISSIIDTQMVLIQDYMPEYICMLRKRKLSMLFKYIMSFPQRFNNNEFAKWFFTNGNKYK